MENEDVIRDQMEDTRTSLSDKLESLEQKVASTVAGATSSVTDTVDSVKETVKETVNSVRDTVQGTISAVQDTVHKGVDAVKHAFDIRGHVEHYPWLMFGGSVLTGFALGSLILPHFRAEEEEYEDDARNTTSKANGRQAHTNGRHGPPDGQGAALKSSAALGWTSEPEERSAPPKEAKERKPAAPSMLSGLFSKFGPEIDRVKKMALGAIVHSVRDMLVKSVPAHMSASLTGIIDSFADKIGADPAVSHAATSGDSQTEGAKHSNGASSRGSSQPQAT